MVVNIRVSGQPVGKGRPRFTRFCRVYTPAKTANAERAIRQAFIDKYGTLHFGGMLSVSVIARFAIPKSDTKKAKQDKLAGLVMPTIKPDIDNIVKLALDALNPIIGDDSAVVEIFAAKEYSEEPETIITIRELGVDDDY